MLPKMKLFLAASTKHLATLFLLWSLCTHICRIPNVAFNGLSKSLCLARFSPVIHSTSPVFTSVSPNRFSFSIRLFSFEFIADVLPLKFVLQLVGDMGSVKGIEMSVALTVADS